MVEACDQGLPGRVVRVVELSDHPGDTLTDAARKHEAAGQIPVATAW